MLSGWATNGSGAMNSLAAKLGGEANTASCSVVSGFLSGIEDDAAHVNPNGGAIALGHPLGMSGARLATTAAYELKRRGGRYALCMMCIGVGQGIAMILEAA